MSETNQLTIDAYNKSVDEYVKSSPQQVDGHLKIWLDACINLLKPHAKILEIGVGHGKDADYLESNDFMVDRTDATHAFVEYQRQNGHDAHILNILTDPIDDQYNMVLADAVWLHFTPEEAALATRKVYDALTEDGIFALCVKEGEGEELTDRKLNATRYFCYWDEAGIRDLLEEAGFKNVDIVRATDYRPDRPGWLMIVAKK